MVSTSEIELLRLTAPVDRDPFTGSMGEEFIQRREAWTHDFQDIDTLHRVSNLVTTRSDVFTVYFRIRNFKQNPDGRLPRRYRGPVADASTPEFIVIDERFMMLVDRSAVNKPSDKAKILYLEKLPN